MLMRLLSGFEFETPWLDHFILIVLLNRWWTFTGSGDAKTLSRKCRRMSAWKSMSWRNLLLVSISSTFYDQIFHSYGFLMYLLRLEKVAFFWCDAEIFSNPETLAEIFFPPDFKGFFKYLRSKHNTLNPSTFYILVKIKCCWQISLGI